MLASLFGLDFDRAKVSNLIKKMENLIEIEKQKRINAVYILDNLLTYDCQGLSKTQKDKLFSILNLIKP